MVSMFLSCWLANRRPIMESVSTCTKDVHPISLWLELEEGPRKQDKTRYKPSQRGDIEPRDHGMIVSL